MDVSDIAGNQFWLDIVTTTIDSLVIEGSHNRVLVSGMTQAKNVTTFVDSHSKEISISICDFSGIHVNPVLSIVEVEQTTGRHGGMSQDTSFSVKRPRISMVVGGKFYFDICRFIGRTDFCEIQRNNFRPLKLVH